MKTLTLLFMSLITFCLHAQEVAQPKKEFVITLSQDKMDLSRGETKEIDIHLTKSKSYVKIDAQMGFSSSIPAGVEISFSPDKGKFDVTKVSIKATDAVAPGQYTVVLNATMNYKTKASVLKINISDKAIVRDGRQ